MCLTPRPPRALAARSRVPQEFSKRYGVADNGLRSSMLRFTNDTIPQSLTRLQDSSVRRRAVRCFRCITGFMGDRDCPTPLSLAQQLLQEVRACCAGVHHGRV